MNKKFSCSLRKHSKRQLEIKMEYPLNPDQKHSVFNLDFYFFFPAQLHINEKRIPAESFLNSMQINTRFSSPLIPLERVIDAENELSPLIRIEKLLDSYNPEIDERRKTLLYELQVLCNLFRAETRNFINLMKKEIKNEMRRDICEERILNMVFTVEAFLSRFRKLQTRFLDPHILEEQRLALNWADESISIITENGFLYLYHLCKPLYKTKELPSVIANFVEGESQYRRSMNYKYNYREDDKLCGENMAYRESVLKKWSQCAMYMDKENSHVPRRIGHLIAATAAALAMLFAVLASIYADNIFPRNSIYWITIIIFSYVFKDRIKEILRITFGNMLPRLTTDQQANLFDPALKNKTGSSSGTIRFCSSDSVPSSIKLLRYSQPNPFRKILPPNDVIHYKKNIKLKSRKLTKKHQRLEAITEIIRFQIDPWLKEMDDTQNTLYRFLEGERVRVEGKRVYRIHLLLQLKEKKQNKKEKLYHYKIICNKSGIVRIIEGKKEKGS